MKIHSPENNKALIETLEPCASVYEHQLIKYMSKFVSLTETEAQALIDKIDAHFYKKGHILLREGEVSNLSYFVIKGCVRQYYIVDGEERTTNFFIEGQPISVYEGSFKMPSKYYLSCMEDSNLSVGTTEPDQEVDPKLAPVCYTAMEEQLTKSQEMLSMYMITSPEERYLNLLKSRPELIDRVPQYQLASYLGIKPESLSRIRKRIMLNDKVE